MKIALVQMTSRSPSPAENVSRAVAFIARAASEGAEFVVLPEFFNVQVFTAVRDPSCFTLAERDDGPTMTRIAEAARSHRVTVLAPLFEEVSAGTYYDTAVLVGPDGAIQGKYHKAHLAGPQTFEKYYFRPGQRFPVFSVRGWRVGVLICYEWRFPEAARCLAVQGADLIVLPLAASPKPILFHALPIRAWENVLYIAACNKVGQEGSWVSGGGSLVAGPNGEMLVQASVDREEIITCALDKARLAQARLDNPIYRDRRPDIYGPIVADPGNPRG